MRTLMQILNRTPRMVGVGVTFLALFVPSLGIVAARAALVPDQIPPPPQVTAPPRMRVSLSDLVVYQDRRLYHIEWSGEPLNSDMFLVPFSSDEIRDLAEAELERMYRREKRP